MARSGVMHLRAGAPQTAAMDENQQRWPRHKWRAFCSAGDVSETDGRGTLAFACADCAPALSSQAGLCGEYGALGLPGREPCLRVGAGIGRPRRSRSSLSP